MAMEPNLGENTSNRAKDPIFLSSDEEAEENNVRNDDNNTQNDKQIVLYDPNSNGSVDMEPQPPSKSPPKVLPSVGAFTVQCAMCFKWRLIPRKEKYEQIREHILEQPFSCEAAKEWRPEISCDEPGDIEQDHSRLWAIDKPNIAKPPPGWERELRIRGEGGSKFADVYYIAPSGKRLRSMVEVQKYLWDHPEFSRQGVTLSQFSFQIPKPLQENYVRKRTARSTTPGDEPSKVYAVNPLSWAAPDDPTELQLGGPSLSSSYSRDRPPEFDSRPPKKKARPSMDHMYSNNSLLDQRKFKVKGPRPPSNGVFEL